MPRDPNRRLRHTVARHSLFGLMLAASACVPGPEEWVSAEGTHPAAQTEVTGVEVHVEPQGWGTIYQQYLGSSRILVKAIPSDRGYLFDHWSGITSLQNPVIIVGETTTAVAAIFTTLPGDEPDATGFNEEEPIHDNGNDNRQGNESENPGADDPITTSPTSGETPGSSENSANLTSGGDPSGNDPLTGIWQNPNDGFLALDSQGDFHIAVYYQLGTTGLLQAVELNMTAQEFTSGLHRTLAGGSPGLTIVVDELASSWIVEQPTSVWHFHVMSEFFGDVEMRTQMTHHKCTLTLDQDAVAIWNFDVERTDSVWVGGNTFTTTYHYVGSQSGVAVSDGQSLVWESTQGSLTIHYEPACVGEKCLDYSNLASVESPPAAWNQG